MRKQLLTVLLAGVLAVIILTWGSVGSAILMLALLLAGAVLLVKWFRDTHDPDDLWIEE